jgi:hypothetical protein
MLVPLTAEESMLAATRGAVGSGALKQQESQRILTAWERQAGRHEESKAETVRPDLAGLGIGFSVESRA